MKVAVIGGGSWGTALSMVLANNEHEVAIHSINQAVVTEINTLHTNQKYLPGVQLPNNITASDSYQEVLQNASYVLLVVPSQAMRSVAKEISSHIEEHAIVIHASKGLETKTLKRMSQIIEEEIPWTKNNVVVISGPSHAEEVSRQIPTTIVSASCNATHAENVQNLFSNQSFRVYTQKDVIGIELGGALKNIIAIASGMSDGLGYGDNTKAALITRGLTEMTRLGVLLGGEEKTFAGLTGMGDLIVTATSIHSRNWRTGDMLASGYTLEEALEQLGMVAEGVKMIEIVYKECIQKLQVDMPITEALYQVIFENQPMKERVNELMLRVYKEE